jgi:hypothetical protein
MMPVCVLGSLFEENLFFYQFKSKVKLSLSYKNDNAKVLMEQAV